MKLPRRTFLHLAAGAAALPAVSRIARADTYPSRPVRLVVGFASRRRATTLTARFSRTMVVGSSWPTDTSLRTGRVPPTNIATEAVVNAAPDGYTLLFLPPTAAINATLYEKLNFNFIRDFAPVAGIIRIPDVMVDQSIRSGPNGAGVYCLRQSQSGQNQFCVSRHRHDGPILSGELFKMMTGVDMVHVAYQGARRLRSSRI